MALSYRLCFSLVLLLSISFVSSIEAGEFKLGTHQVNQPFSGLIGDKNTYVFNLNKTESMIIEVTQPNTDLQLNVIELNADNSESVIFKSSIPANKWLAEKIIVNANQCTLCKIQILPTYQGNNNGNYTLSAKYVFANEQSQYHALLTQMTTASTLWFKESKTDHTLNSAINLYQNIASRAISTPYRNIYLSALYYQASLQHLVGNYSQQEQLLHDIINHTTSTGADSSQVNTIMMGVLIDLGNISRNTKAFDNATDYFNKAFQLAVLSNHKLMQARVLESRGLIASEQGNYADAIAFSAQANQIYINEGDWHSSIKSLIASGWFNFRQGRPELALNYYQQALSYASKANLLAERCDILTKMATVYRHVGDLEQASSFVNQALAHSSKLRHSHVDGWSKQEKARILMKAGMFNLAQDWLNKALVAFNKVSATSDIFNVYYFLGVNHDNKGEYQLAEQYHKKVLAFDQKNGNAYDIGSTYYHLARNALYQSDFIKAQTYQQQALNLLTSTDDMNLLGNNYSQAAYIFFNNNDKAKAKVYFEKAIALQTSSKNTLGLIQTQYWLAKTQTQAGYDQLALNTIIGATKSIQTLQKKLSREDFIANFLALGQQINSLHIDLLNTQQAEPIETLTIAEIFRSQALTAKLNNTKQTHQISHQTKKQQQALHQQLQSSVVNYLQLSSPSARNKIASETRLIAEQLQEINNRRHSLTKSSKPQQPYQFSIQTIQQNLQPNHLLLYFDTSEINSYLWLISNEKIRTYSLPSAAKLSTLVTQVMKKIKQPLQQFTIQASDKSKAKTPSAIAQLSTTLLAAINDDLANAEHLTIIPDGPLHYLPFSVLEFGQHHQPLINKFSISYAPSLSVLQQLHNITPIDHNNNILLVANPTMTPSQRVLNDSDENNYRLGFYSKELPYTAFEANYIKAIAQQSVTMLVRDNANKTSLYNQPLNSYQILHFATHGIANSYQQSLGGLVLSNTSNADNLLLAPEIINLPLNADLVVLSGCETAAGKMVDGEGVFSLSRSFFSAGTKRVIASLWPVQDDATAKLMKAFYQYLIVEKLPIEQALQQAKRYVKNFTRKNGQKPWKDPYYWAGFVLQGPGGHFID